MTDEPNSDACLAEAVKRLAEGRMRPDPDLLRSSFDEILSGAADEVRIAAFLMGLRARGETATDLMAGAGALRAQVRALDAGGDLVDTCGTGGLSWTSLNTSTASACVAAAGGAKVAKHGNRSVPPKTGSADVLEALGVNLEADDAQLRSCLDHAGVAFLFAPARHGAMRHAAPVRRRLAIRTIFNLLGPLANPAGATRQVLGVFAQEWIEPMAKALHALGSAHALVVHGVDGIDEISIAGATEIAEVGPGGVERRRVTPEEFGIAPSPLSALRGGFPPDNAEAVRRTLAGEPGPFADAVALNAGAALYVGGRAADLGDGVEQARRLLAAGAGAATLDALIRYSGGQE